MDTEIQNQSHLHQLWLPELLVGQLLVQTLPLAARLQELLLLYQLGPLLHNTVAMPVEISKSLNWLDIKKSFRFTQTELYHQMNILSTFIFY